LKRKETIKQASHKYDFAYFNNKPNPNQKRSCESQAEKRGVARENSGEISIAKMVHTRSTAPRIFLIIKAEYE